jgi:sulfoxide reductase catalytic subunit YedY
MLIKRPRSWKIPEARATPEAVYLSRREVLRTLGLVGVAAGTGCYLSVEGADNLPAADSGPPPPGGLYPAERNTAYRVDERPITPEALATRFNNYYEFTVAKDRVWELVGDFKTEPWTVKIGGLVKKPQTLDVKTLETTLALEERVYRFRCVEAWSATIPWTGFPLAGLVKLVEPLSSARFVGMRTVHRPEEMPGIAALPGYPWPYTEGLRIDEATNELTMMVTGVYGKRLPAQNGAPLRLIVPWKYGFKSIKSIVAIDFLDERPPTFWNTIAPHEYGFLANVDPQVPHPRWSQAQEKLIDNGEVIPTQLYNGYGPYVAKLY